MATRNIVCECGCAGILGVLAEPDGKNWSEDEWAFRLSGYRRSQDPSVLGVASLDTNNVVSATDWMDCLHHSKLQFTLIQVNGPGGEPPSCDSFVLAVEHSSDGVVVDGEVVTQTGDGVQTGIDIEAYNYVRFKVKTAEGVGSWVGLTARTEYLVQ